MHDNISEMKVARAYAMSDWRFKESPSTAVLINKKILRDDRWIAYVSHDAGDAGWQFHTDDKEVLQSDAMVVSLQQVVSFDISVNEIADLPLGWQAWRNTKTSHWQRGPLKS